MYSLIAYATEWGYSHGGINCFNTDLLSAFGYAYPSETQIICIVSQATDEDIADAKNTNVILVPLSQPTINKIFSEADAEAGIAELNRRNISFDPHKTVWLGHDLISGLAANYSSKATQSKSAIIHHMSYDHYESYAEDSETAKTKINVQKSLFDNTNIALAVGPLLRDALSDLLTSSKVVHMLVPGLAEINSKPIPSNFTAFFSGRLGDKIACIKQGYLGVAAFANAHKNAKAEEFPTALRNKPKLILRGLDYDQQITNVADHNPEDELKKFAYDYAQCVINVHALPYTKSRQELYDELSASSLAMMPSWHEGFGLAGWEAIAAGVPLIVTKDSGLFKLLDEEFPGAGPGCVYSLDISGFVSHPYFNENDLRTISGYIKSIAADSTKAKKKALYLRDEMLKNYTWTACAESMVKAFTWDVRKIAIAEKKFKSENSSSDSMPILALSHNNVLQMPDTRNTGELTITKLLRAEEELVSFDQSRKPDLDILIDWLGSDNQPQSVRLITGSGGAGKTRLSLELCKEARKLGWTSGFLSNSIDVKKIDDVWKELIGINKNLLIVIDYAETRQATFLSLIVSILQYQSSKYVRILLIARDGGEWWETLPSRDSICAEFLNSYNTTGPHRLSPLYVDLQSRALGYQNALAAFAKYLTIPAPSVIPNLSGEHFKNPLYIQMAALLALLGNKQSTTQGLTRAILQHEKNYWLKSVSEFYQPNFDIHIEQLLSLTTLAGGFQTVELAFKYWGQINKDRIDFITFTKLYQSMQSLYPGKVGIEPVRPDLLGEALVVNALMSNYATELLDAVLTSTAEKNVRLHSLTVLARVSQNNLTPIDTLIKSFSKNLVSCCIDMISVCSETQSNLPLIAKKAFETLVPNVKSQVFNLIEEEFTNDSSELNEFYCAVSNYNCERLRLKHLKKPKNETHLVNYAFGLITFSSSLSNIGRYADAIEASLESVKILEKLDQQFPQVYEEDLATAFSNYASHLHDAGKNIPALDYAKKALDIRQRLAALSDDVKPSLAISYGNYAHFLNEDGKSKDAIHYSKLALDIRIQLLEESDFSKSQLASSLNNYSIYLSEDGDTENAIKYAESALEITQELAIDKRDLYEPDLAMSFNNYSNRLVANGNFKRAVEYVKQSIEIVQRLKNKNPDRYESDFARSLGNYASHLSDNGDHKSALTIAKQALEIQARLAKENPDRHEPDFATALSNYASHLSDNSDFKSALAIAKEALDIRERLTKENSDRHEPDFATSLSNYANHLGDNGKFKEALFFTKQALDIRERLTKENPDRHEPDFIISLNNYSSHLNDNGFFKDALMHGKQGLNAIERLAKKTPNRYEDQFASFLWFYSILLSENGEVKDAINLSEQALEIHERLSTDHPERYESDLAKMLNDYANHLDKDGNNEKAVKLSSQALEIHQRLVKHHPEKYEPDLAKTLNDYANHLDKNKDERNEDALKHSGHGLDIYRRLVKILPERYEPDLAKTLNDYANHLNKGVNNDYAIKLSEQALEIYQRLIEVLPERFESDFAKALNDHANHLNKGGNNEDAIKLSRQALEIYQRLSKDYPGRYQSALEKAFNDHQALITVG